MSSSAPLLLVSFVSSRGWTSRVFSAAQFERALPQLKRLDFPLLVSDYQPDDVCSYCGLHLASPCDSAPADICSTAVEFMALDKATDSTAPANGKRSAVAGAGRAWEVEK